ncbi:heavy-metal-associated domain-containing protein [Citricoccus zhacaiensis]
MNHPTRTPLPMATGCSCCTPDPAASGRQTSAVVATPAGAATYRVEGMTCGHCAGNVMDAITALPGVEDVRVDLVAGGTSTVTVTGPTEAEAVRSAIIEAGYTPAA